MGAIMYRDKVYGAGGSGGGGSTVTITPTLSTGTKIADFEIDGTPGELYAPQGGGGAIDYSTTEQNTGQKWIDGKPIYQITVELSTAITINANGWTNTTISKTNIDNIVSVTAGKKNNNFWGQVMGAINSSLDYLQIGNARNTSISVDFYTFQYTKTTD